VPIHTEKGQVTQFIWLLGVSGPDRKSICPTSKSAN
jgi:hypothetical protein